MRPSIVAVSVDLANFSTNTMSLVTRTKSTGYGQRGCVAGYHLVKGMAMQRLVCPSVEATSALGKETQFITLTKEKTVDLCQRDVRWLMPRRSLISELQYRTARTTWLPLLSL
jgi:hypothetical protein